MKKIFFFTIFVFFLTLQTVNAQKFKFDRGLHQNILKVLKSEIEDKYFDAGFGGINVEENYKKANDLISSANSDGEMRNIIAEFLFRFEDPHLFFLPPVQTIKVDYGWKMSLIGDKAFVTGIDGDSDAAKKGVKIGDQIYMVEGFIPTRKDFWKIKYQFEVLNPQVSLNVILIKPSGNKYKVELKAKTTESKILNNFAQFDSRNLMIEDQNLYDEKTHQLSSDEIPGLFVWKLPSFEISTVAIDKMMDRAKKSKALILDLRGNDQITELFWKSRILANIENNFVPYTTRAGVKDTLGRDDGDLIALSRLLGNVFDKEINIGEQRKRKDIKSLTAKSLGKDNFSGEIVVLIDGETGGVSEMLARILQLEKRGKIIGDQSAGAVRRTKFISKRGVTDLNTPYAINITNADIVMSDGQRLEKIGVTPDEKLLPTALDLSNKRDPVLARAAKILGFGLTPEQAGTIFDDKK